MNGWWYLPLKGSLWLSLPFCLWAHPGGHHAGHSHEELRPTTAANVFLKSMSPEFRERLVFPFDHEERLNWHFVPRRRQGVEFKTLDPGQRHGHWHVFAGLMSDGGIEQVQRIMKLEGILGQLTGAVGFRDPERYFVTGFLDSDPLADDTPWGWRFEGHHLSLNYTLIGDRVIGATPAFFGANPARVPSGPEEGWRAMADEEDLGRALMMGLDETKRAQALYSERAPRDIVTQALPRVELEGGVGIAASALDPDSFGKLKDLIRLYLGRHDARWALGMWDDLVEAGWEHVYFAWAGALEPGQGHYYRVHGPTILIEYDNVQGGANHIHAVLRDPRGDFGEDPLREHYRTSPHHRE